MADILISKFTTQIPRVGATPATPGFAESEGQDPVAPSGTPQVYTPVTIGSPANGLSIDGSQVLTIGLASTSTTGALSSTDWNTFNNKLNLTSPITGYTLGANTALAATDTILQAFGKVQGQINARISGTIASGQVAFGTGVNTVGGDSGLTWDNVNKILSSRFRVNSPTNLIGSGIWGVDTALAFNVNSVERMRIDSSGRLLINTTSGTNTLDVNGTARIRTISNLGSAASSVLVPSATGVVSLRTLAELASDAGLTNFWTLVGSDIYRNSAVAVGRTTIPTNATFAVQSLTATATHQFFQLLNNSGSSLLTLTQDGVLSLNSPLARFGNPTVDVAAQGVHIKGSGSLSTDRIFRVQNSSDQINFDVNGDGRVNIRNHQLTVGNPTSVIAQGSTFKSSSNLSTSVAFRVMDSTEKDLFSVFSNGAIIRFNNPSAAFLTGFHYKGGFSDGTRIFNIDNSSDVSIIEILGNRTINFADQTNFAFNATTGTKIGTATNQKIGFFNATPIVQPSGDILTALSNLGLIASPTITQVDQFAVKTTASADQTLPSGVLTILDYDTTLTNNSTATYTVGTTGRITINTTGIYTITAGVVIEADAVTALESAFLGIFRNGDLVAISSINTTIAAGAQSGLSTSTILSLTATDIIDCRALVNSVGGVANGLARRLGTLLGANATQVNSLSITKNSM